MGSTKKKQTKPTSDRQKWEVIFKALKQLLRKQQTQLDSLLQERTFLLERINIQQQGWNSDVLLLQDHISQLRGQLDLSKLGNLFEIAKGNLLAGCKKRDAKVYKHKLEHARSELDDFKAWFDILSHRCPDKEDISPDSIYECLKAKGGRDSSPTEASKRHCKKLETQVATLKREYEKLSVKNSSEVSALQAEIKFAWNQYNEMEGKYSNQLQTKNDEVDHANEKIMKLLARMEQLQLLNSKKDDGVATLTANVNKLQAEASQKDGEISRLLKELDLLRSKSAAGTSALKHCQSEPSSSASKGRRNRRNRESSPQEKESSSAQLEATVATLRADLNKLKAESNQKDGEIATLSNELKLLGSRRPSDTPVLSRRTNEPSSSIIKKGRGIDRTRGSAALKEEASSAQLVSENGVRRSKRKQNEVVSIEDTPRLFTSQFKIPKLKSQSPHGR